MMCYARLIWVGIPRPTNQRLCQVTPADIKLDSVARSRASHGSTTTCYPGRKNQLFGFLD